MSPALLEERRRKQTPLKDVAGMLRSFSYAARSALEQAVQSQPNLRSTLEPWAAQWESAACNAFLRGYREATAARTEILPNAITAQQMLLALLLEKAFYELMYELNNRPSWLNIPLNGLLALVGNPA